MPTTRRTSIRVSKAIDEETAHWRREKVSFAAAYGNERVLGYLYIPKRATPPYQTIVYWHPGMSLRLPSPQPAEASVRLPLKSGRAVLLPVLKGHYQRRYTAPPAGPNDARDRLILESKDFRRSIDYLVSRPDVDRDRLGVYGFSRGASVLPVLAVGEQRLKAAVVASVGLIATACCPKPIRSISFPASRCPRSWPAADSISSFRSTPHSARGFRCWGRPSRTSG